MVQESVVSYSRGRHRYPGEPPRKHKVRSSRERISKWAERAAEPALWGPQPRLESPASRGPSGAGEGLGADPKDKPQSPCSGMSWERPFWKRSCRSCEWKTDGLTLGKAQPRAGKHSCTIPFCSPLGAGDTVAKPPGPGQPILRGDGTGLPAASAAHFRRGQWHRPHSIMFLQKFRSVFHPRPSQIWPWMFQLSSVKRGGLGPGPAVPEVWTLLVTCYKERMDGPLARRQ